MFIVMEFIALVIIIGFVIFIQNRLYSKQGLKNVQYSCAFSLAEVYEGDEVELIEEITNEKLLPLPWIKAEISVSKWLDLAEMQSVVTDQTRFVSSFFMLKSYHKVSRKWKVKCLKRGVYSLDTVVLVASDLFGNVTLSKSVNFNIEITVLPKPITVEEFPISSKHLLGELLVKRHLIFDPFHIAGVKEYQDGDALNRINWLATAKEKHLMVHQNDYTTSQSVTVILNIQSCEYDRINIADEAKVENCIRICASCLALTLETGITVKFLANAPIRNSDSSVESDEFAGAEHVLNLFRTLANLQLMRTEGFDSYLNSLYGKITSTDVYIVTSYVNEAILEFSRNKKHEGASVKLIVLGAIPLDSEVEIFDFSNCFYQTEN